MQIDAEKIDLFECTLEEAIDKIFKAFPTPEQLDTSSIRLTIEEELALEKIQGMMWPLIFTGGLAQRYGDSGLERPHISGEISFPEDGTVVLGFKIEAVPADAA